MNNYSCVSSQHRKVGLSRSTFFWVTPKALSYNGFTSHSIAHYNCAILTYSIPVAKS